MNELERTKERLNRMEQMMIDVFARLQALEIDNVKNKTAIQHHVNNMESHKI